MTPATTLVMFGSTMKATTKDNKGVKMAGNNNKRKAIKDMTVQELIDSCMGLWR